MIVAKEDAGHLQNLITAISKGQFELRGVEVKFLASAMDWLVKLKERFEHELAPPAAPAPLAPAPPCVVLEEERA